MRQAPEFSQHFTIESVVEQQAGVTGLERMAPLERKGNLTERSSPRRAFPERSRWVRVEAVRGLALRD